MMPKNEQAPTPVGSPDHELALKLVGEYRQKWLDQLKESGVDPVTFARISVLALTHISASIALDIGMTDEQFSHVCHHHFKEIEKVLPKFAH